MLIYREETFGPVAGLTPFDDEAQAIELRERHRLRPRRVLPHPRLRPPAAGRREARLRHRRRQHRHHLGRQRAVRRRQGVGLRPRGRLGRHRRVPDGQVRLRRRRRDLAACAPCGSSRTASRSSSRTCPSRFPARARWSSTSPGRPSIRSTCGSPAARWPPRGRSRGPGGSEGAGVTEEGRRVAFRGAGIGVARDGSYAERIAVPASGLADVPDGVTDAQAAGVGVAGVTALDIVELAGGRGRHDRARARRVGRRRLLHGADGPRARRAGDRPDVAAGERGRPARGGRRRRGVGRCGSRDPAQRARRREHRRRCSIRSAGRSPSRPRGRSGAAA